MKPLLLFSAVVLVAFPAAAEPPRRFVALEERLMERAEKIPIPSVEFKDTTLADALEFLRREARRHDPKHQGIPIEVHADPWPMIETLPNSKMSKPTPPGGWPLYEPLKQRITLSLHHTSLVEALRYTVGFVYCDVVSSPTAFRILPHPESVERLVTHTIPLGAAPIVDLEKIRADPKQYFTACGVSFNNGADCSLEDGGATLVVTISMNQLDLFHAILENLGRDGSSKKSPKSAP